MPVVDDAYRFKRAEEESYVDWTSHIDPSDLDELDESLDDDREVEVDDDFEVPF